MGAFRHGFGFRIVGVVSRRFVTTGRKAAFLTVEVSTPPRAKKYDLRAFDEQVIAEIEELGAGMTVEITGAVEMEVLKGRDKQKVIVDGREKWVPAFTARAIKVEGSSRRPAAQAPSQAPGAAPSTDRPAQSFDDQPAADRFGPSADSRKGWDDSDPGADRFDKANVKF